MFKQILGRAPEIATANRLTDVGTYSVSVLLNVTVGGEPHASRHGNSDAALLFRCFPRVRAQSRMAILFSLFRGGEKHMFQRLVGKIGLGLILSCAAASLALAQVPNVDTSKFDSEKAKAGKTKANVEQTTKSSADEGSNAVKKGAADAQNTGSAVKKKASDDFQEGAAAGTYSAQAKSEQVLCAPAGQQSCDPPQQVSPRE